LTTYGYLLLSIALVKRLCRKFQFRGKSADSARISDNVFPTHMKFGQTGPNVKASQVYFGVAAALRIAKIANVSSVK